MVDWAYTSFAVQAPILVAFALVGAIDPNLLLYFLVLWPVLLLLWITTPSAIILSLVCWREKPLLVMTGLTLFFLAMAEFLGLLDPPRVSLAFVIPYLVLHLVLIETLCIRHFKK